MLKILYTTGEVGKIWGCSPKTIANRHNDGKLKGYTVPGPGGDRRFPREHVLRFICDNGRSPSLLEGESDPLRLMYVGDDTKGAQSIASESLTVTAHANVTTAERMLVREFPMCVVIDCVTVQGAKDFATRLMTEEKWKGLLSVIGLGRAGMEGYESLSRFHAGPIDWPTIALEAIDLISPTYVRG